MNIKTMRARNKSGNFNCDICNKKEFLEIHHISGRNIANPNQPSNLCCICSNCHYKVHLGVLLIEQWVNSTSGKMLLWHTPDEPPDIKDSVTHIIK